MATKYLFAAGRVHENKIYVVPEQGDNGYYSDEQWHMATVNAITAHPGELASEAYFMGITDRDLGLPSHIAAYTDLDERAAYLAGKCAAQDKYSGSGLSLEAIQAQLQELMDQMDDESFWRWGGA